MFRNNYDNDAITFSPQGRIFQIEYAGEAVKQGSVVCGLVSKTHVVLVAIKRNAEDLSSYQKKVFEVDEHLAMAIAGLTSDARVLLNVMKMHAMGHRMEFGRGITVSRLVDRIGSRAQMNTQVYGRRPYGIGLLIAGVDEDGPHLFEFQPSGLTEEMTAFAIGARSQMARTYLEKHVREFADCSREELVRHGLRALKESLVQDRHLTVDNTTVAIVGFSPSPVAGRAAEVERLRLYDGQDVRDWVDSITAEESPQLEQQQQQQEPAGGDAMDVDG